MAACLLFWHVERVHGLAHQLSSPCHTLYDRILTDALVAMHHWCIRPLLWRRNQHTGYPPVTLGAARVPEPARRVPPLIFLFTALGRAAGRAASKACAGLWSIASSQATSQSEAETQKPARQPRRTAQSQADRARMRADRTTSRSSAETQKLSRQPVTHGRPQEDRARVRADRARTLQAKTALRALLEEQMHASAQRRTVAPMSAVERKLNARLLAQAHACQAQGREGGPDRVACPDPRR